MELLIVHRDAEIGEQLVQMVKDYTEHPCDFAGSQVAAIDWARRNQRCRLLITQLDGDGLDGLNLGAALSEIFPSLQTLFLPPYPAEAQRLVVNQPKVFPEPIDGEQLLDAIERVNASAPGSPDLFHLVDIVQMCCLSGRSGALQMVKAQKSGIVFLRNGKIVHAETASARGKEALLQMAGWEMVEFAYDRTVRPPAETITAPWEEIFMEALGVDREREQQHEAGGRG
jgi:hypothetical protein